MAILVAMQRPGLAQPNANEPKHLRAAQVLVQTVQPDETSYRHKDSVVHWKGEDGAPVSVCQTDCSGFVDALLKHSYGYDRKSFEKWFSVPRPTAADYHDAIAKRHGFQRIERLRDAHPGDILAVKYPAGSANTGHIMLVAAPPRRLKPSPPLVDGAEQWEVAVIDCSHSGHGTTDTRHLAGGKSRAGLGQGTLRVYTAPSGAVAGYTWSTYSKSEYNDQKAHHMEIGRLDSAFKP
jgi:hypothetical protein